MYINIETNEVITRQELEKRFSDPLVGFPEDVADEALFDFGYANVTAAPYPQLETQQVLTKGEVVKQDGKYIQNWVVTTTPVLASQVDTERDTRIAAGVTFQGKQYQSRSTDRENISGAAQLAFMAIVGGAQPGDLMWAGTGEEFQWIASDNSRVSMDAQTVVNFGKAAAQRKQALVFAASNLKQMDPIPSDFADDKYWPE